LSCEKCQKSIAKYQKDGPGILKRLYLDRIVELKELDKSKSKNFIFPNCGVLLGVKYIYEKENRPAYRLFAGAISKKILKGNFNYYENSHFFARDDNYASRRLWLVERGYC
jgi:hypothetical protein